MHSRFWAFLLDQVTLVKLCRISAFIRENKFLTEVKGTREVTRLSYCKDVWVLGIHRSAMREEKLTDSWDHPLWSYSVYDT